MREANRATGGRGPEAGGNRALILEAIRLRPGLTVGELHDTFALGWGALYHHLRRLEEDGSVEIQRVGRRVLVFPAGSGSDPAVARAAGLLKGRTVRRIAQVLVKSGEVTSLELVHGFDASPQVVYHHLRRLAEAGLAELVEAGRVRRVLATPLLREALEELARVEAVPPGEKTLTGRLE